MKPLLVCLFIILTCYQYSFASQKDSVTFKKYNLGIEIPYSFISQKNLELVSNQTAFSSTTFCTGLTIAFKYNFTKQTGFQIGISDEIGQYTRETGYGAYGHRFHDIQIPVKISYTFNKKNKPVNLFISAGYSFSFIINKTAHNSKIFLVPLPEEVQLSNTPLQSLVFAQIGFIYNKTKIKPFVSFIANYSSYWREYNSINLGIYF